MAEGPVTCVNEVVKPSVRKLNDNITGGFAGGLFAL